MYTPLGLEKLQHWIDMGRLDASQTITLKEIFDSGIVGKFKHGVALVGNVRGAVPLLCVVCCRCLTDYAA